MLWHRAVSLHLIPKPLSQISATVCEADQSEHLWPTVCPLTKSKTAAITGTQWRGKIRVPKVFNSSIRGQNLLRRIPFFLASFSRLVMDLSFQVFCSAPALAIPRSALFLLYFFFSLTVNASPHRKPGEHFSTSVFL